MALIYNEETKVFTLQTKHSAYQMKVGSYNVLLHLYYGRRVEDCDMSYLISGQDRGFSGNPYEAGLDRGFSLDLLPQEYPSFGVGDYRTSCIEIVNPDGSNAVDFRYVSHRIYHGKYSLKGLPALYVNDGDIADTLEICLEDSVTKVQAVLYYGVMENLDIITRAGVIMNPEGRGEICINRAMAACLDLMDDRYDLIHFYGRHAMERETERSPLHHGIQSAGSVRGSSSHHHNPFVILCGRDTTEDYGDCYGMSLLYSGNFLAEIEVDQINQTRAVMGIHPQGFEFRLNPGEEFIMPETAMVYTEKGLGELSRIYHRAYRHNLCRGEYKTRRRPVLINNWEATYFGFTAEKLVRIAEESSRLGIELFVLDDGWFGKRDDDTSGLGDWVVNEEKLKGTMKELADRINAAGMKFGLWFEPEMVSEDSDLYRAHPDWALNMPGRPGNRSRYQFVLDFSRQEVRDYIYESMCRVLDSANIEYVKWDMNRSLSNVYSAVLPGERQGEVSHRYVLGVYEFLEKLTARYPHILFEGCSGGGGRFDAGMLYYTPQIWCSDDTDAIERIKIQYGTSFGYPISAVGSHVSASPNHQTGRITPLAARGVAAMSGSFGYELDISRMTEEEKELVIKQVKEFKERYELIQDGDYYRLTDPYQNIYYAAWEFVSPDRSEALLNYISTRVGANTAPVIINWKGLDESKQYCLNGEETYSGAQLMNGGILIPVPAREYDSFVYYAREAD